MNREGREEAKVHEENHCYISSWSLCYFVPFVLMGFIVVFRTIREIRGKLGLGKQRRIISTEDFMAKKNHLLGL